MSDYVVIRTIYYGATICLMKRLGPNGICLKSLPSPIAMLYGLVLISDGKLYLSIYLDEQRTRKPHTLIFVRGQFPGSHRGLNGL